MNPIDFLNNVVAHRELTGLGGEFAREDKQPSPDDLVYVRHEARDSVMALRVGEILKHSWQDLEAVLAGKRRPDLMIHITRIVGYFSRTHNWNRSKLAELRDRHAGDYALPDKGRGFEMRPPSKKEKPVAV